MAFFGDLEGLILDRHLKNKADELIVLSGYIGPLPIENLAKRNIKSKIIWGTLAEDKKTFTSAFHKKYQAITSDVSNTTEVLYKLSYDHSKIYCWLKNDKPVEIISGSANFSNRGLKGSHRETLFNVNASQFLTVHNYLKVALQGSVLCTSHSGPDSSSMHESGKLIPNTASMLDSVISTSPPIADIYLGGRGRTIQNAAGLNWGQGQGHNSKDCGELRLRADLVRAIPNLFPNNGININLGKGQSYRNISENAEILFDDGFVMDASFEGAGGSAGNGNRYYKQLTSFPDKNTFGAYFRKRLGLGKNDKITDQHFSNYGRDSLRLSLLDEGIYYADFSRP